METTVPNPAPVVGPRRAQVAILGDDSFAHRVWLDELQRSKIAELAAVFATSGDLLSSPHADVDLLLVGDWTRRQTRLVRWALRHGWDVATNELFSYDEGQHDGTAGLARELGRSLIAGLANSYWAVSPDLVDLGGTLGPVTAIDVSWRCPAAAPARETAPFGPVHELAPRLLAMALPYLGGADVVRVAVDVTGGPQAWTVTIVVHTARGVPLTIRITREGTMPDVGTMVLLGTTRREIDVAQHLATAYAMQFHRSFGLIGHCRPQVWVDPPMQVLALMRSILGSLAEGTVVDVA